MRVAIRTAESVLVRAIEMRHGSSVCHGIAFDRWGNAFLSFSNPVHCLSVYRGDGTFVGRIGQHGEGNGQFKWPCQTAVDDEGLVHVCDSSNIIIQVFRVDGYIVRVYGESQLIEPRGIAINASGDVLVTCYASPGIVVRCCFVSGFICCSAVFMAHCLSFVVAGVRSERQPVAKAGVVRREGGTVSVSRACGF